MKFISRNISTYAQLKMKEVFILFGNPFSRKNCKKNCYLTLCQKYHKRINFKAMSDLKSLDEKDNDSPSFVSIDNSNINENNKSNLSNNENDNNNNFNIIVIHKNKRNEINY